MRAHLLLPGHCVDVMCLIRKFLTAVVFISSLKISFWAFTYFCYS